ncbi:MAG: Tm-1-like ATP-binding domain-containing protein, partial [Planctomycetaceae bacterium]|nr:Tm-1-like ATP-binding domain-containing protein [Planctomycetaceae bacterium]
MTVLLFATLDTKGVEAAFVRDRLRALGVAVELVDCGTLGHPTVQADVPREAVLAAIDRIEAVNPGLNAVVHRMYDRALREADGPVPEGPFRGVPFLVKDLLTWIPGEPITNGSRFFQGWLPPVGSEMARRYRQAGLIIVSKTNTPEFGLVPFTESEFLGTCRNPWNPERTTGGSSGGSAAAVASGMVPMAGG